MIRFDGRAILVDVEGTTSSIQFVVDVLFPYARRTAGEYLAARWSDADVQRAVELIARDAGADSLDAWLHGVSPEERSARVEAEVLRLMDGDVKATGLKELQGVLWRAGYENGELKSHVYPDVPPALARWKDAGLEVRIYSSGSVAAQKLFFRYTELGDLLPFFNGHYDTTTGPKREADS
ncbi:MAG: acireductone synthase, partial [Planctomycetia bacterium]